MVPLISGQNVYQTVESSSLGNIPTSPRSMSSQRAFQEVFQSGIFEQQSNYSRNRHTYTVLDVQLGRLLTDTPMNVPINSIKVGQVRQKLCELVSQLSPEIETNSLSIETLLKILATSTYKGEGKPNSLSGLSIFMLALTIYFIFKLVESNENYDSDGVWNYFLASFFCGVLTGMSFYGILISSQRKKNKEEQIRFTVGKILSNYANFLKRTDTPSIPEDIQFWGEHSQAWFRHVLQAPLGPSHHFF